MTQRTEHRLTFPSLRSASAASGIPYAALQSLKSEGLPGFEPSGRVHLHLALGAFFTRTDGESVAPPVGLRNWREALNKFTAERQQLRLAKERESVVDRAWVASAITTAAQDLNRIRLKSEADDPLLFAATNGDVVECRTIMRRIWDHVCAEIQSLSGHFDESTQTK